MTYIICHPDGTIKTFMEEVADVRLESGETVTFSSLPMAEYAAQFVLSVRGQSCLSIIAHVGDPAIEVEVSAPGREAVPLDVNGEMHLVTLQEGKGCYTLATDVPGIYCFSPWEKNHYCSAGNGSLSIEVVEAQS